MNTTITFISRREYERLKRLEEEKKEYLRKEFRDLAMKHAKQLAEIVIESITVDNAEVK